MFPIIMFVFVFLLFLQAFTWNPQGKRKRGGEDQRDQKQVDITQTAGNNWRGSPRTGDIGEKLCMAYAPGGANGLVSHLHFK